VVAMTSRVAGGRIASVCDKGGGRKERTAAHSRQGSHEARIRPLEGRKASRQAGTACGCRGSRNERGTKRAMCAGAFLPAATSLPSPHPSIGDTADGTYRTTQRSAIYVIN
jgi:hypothetical protein